MKDLTPMPLFMILWVTVLLFAFTASKEFKKTNQEIKELRAKIEEIQSPKTFLPPTDILETPGREN